MSDPGDVGKNPKATEKSALVDPNEERDWRKRARSFCTIEWNLIPCKVFYFMFGGSIGCLMPYLSIYFKQRGISPQQIGLISGLRPLVGVVSGPLWGIIADRYNIRKGMMIFATLMWVAFYLGLGFYPPPDRASKCPRNLTPHRTPTGLDKLHKNNNTHLLKEDIGWMYEPKSLFRGFIATLLFIVCGELVQAPAGALADTGTLQQLGGDVGAYGRQRVWGALGFGSGALVLGTLVTQSRKAAVVCGVSLVFSDYMITFYAFAGLMAVAVLAATQYKFLDGKGGSEIQNETKGLALIVMRLFLNIHYGSFLAVSFFMGVCNGVIWGFLFWHLENLGASQLLMGVSTGIECISEIIMFFFIHQLIELTGHIGVMYIGLFCYAVRFAIYSFIVNPWWVLTANILQGITFASVWSSLASYTAMAVPGCSLATIQGLLHGIYWGLGVGCGTLLGGLLVASFGARLTFTGFNVACVFVLILFFLAQKFGSKPMDKASVHESMAAVEEKEEKNTEKQNTPPVKLND